MSMHQRPNSQPIRSFVALDVASPQLRHAIPPLQNQLEGPDLNIRFVDPSILHLTLKFLGDIYAENVDAIVKELETIKLQEFEIYLQGLGVFPNLKRPRVIFIDIKEGRDEVIKLGNLVNEATIKAGLAPADRTVTPHLTLGRVKKGPGKKKHPSETSYFAQRFEPFRNVKLGRFLITEFHLKQSTLTSQGPIYSNLASISLQRDP
ncbi:MAG: RNA 2',3'-cyclic phosphodiesterase [Candidatus Ranarchaeia archaeon]